MFTFPKTTDEHIKQLQAAVKRAICTNHNAKMAGMISLSTSPLLNSHCQAMRAAAAAAAAAGKKNIPICGSCYACRMCQMFQGLREKLAENSALLSSSVLPVDALPLLNCQVFRLESFGDVINHNHLENLLNLVKKNKSTRFALWSKHIDLVKKIL